MQIIRGVGGWTAPQAGDANDWDEQLAVPVRSVGTDCIPGGFVDIAEDLTLLVIFGPALVPDQALRER